MENVTTTNTGWRVTNWGTWGWIETILKLVGIGAGIAAFFASGSDEALVIGGNPHLAAVILVAFMAVGMLFAFVMRIVQREIISILFSVANVSGHFALLVALLRVPADVTLPVIFGAFFVFGELSKQRFLSLTGYTEGGMPISRMVMFSRTVAAVYALLVILVLI